MKIGKIISINTQINSVNNNQSGIYRRESELIVVLPLKLANIIGTDSIYMSEFIIAKIKGKIKNIEGHKEITDLILSKVPESLSSPLEIIQDTRYDKKYLFVNIDPLHEIVVEISRNFSFKSEINTIHLINVQELKRLERKFPVVYSSGETPLSRIRASLT